MVSISRYFVQLALIVFILMTSAVSAQPLDHVRLQMKWKHQFQFAGYYAAIEKGFYRDVGLEVTLIEAPDVGDPVDRVLKGEAEFGVGNSELLLMYAQGDPIVMLAPIYQHSPLVLIARYESGIDTIQNLVGKRILVEPQSADLFAMMRSAGVPEDEVTVVHHTFDIDHLLDGTVDAMSAYQTDELFKLQKSGINVRVFTPRMEGFDFYGDTLFTTREQVEQHPERVRKFLEASLRGWAYAVEHPEEIAELIYNKYSKRHSMNHLLYEAERAYEMMVPKLITIGHSNPGRWRHVADTYASLGMMDGNIDLEPFFYDKESPQADFTWVYRMLIVAGLLVLIAAFIATLTLYMNARYRRENEYRQEAEERLHNIVELADEGFVFVQDHTIMEVNDWLCQLLGKTREQLVGEPVTVLANPAYHKTLLIHLTTKHSKPCMLVCDRNAGSPLQLECQSQPMVWNNRLTQMLSIRNLTERYALTDALEKKQVELEKAIRELEQTNEQLREAMHDSHVMAEKAKEADQFKSDFLAAMSHDLRTPMTSILGAAEAIERELDHLGKDHSQTLTTYVQMVHRNGQHMLNLINDILDLSRIEAGKLKLDLHECATHELIEDIKSVIIMPCEKKGLAFYIKGLSVLPEQLVTDPVRFKQILVNLLGNAVRFTETGSITLSVERVQDENEQTNFIFDVIDTGMGIASSMHSKLFQPFMQVHDHRSDKRVLGGTGLGLSISKKLSQAMGGNVTLVQSTPQQGSQFRFTMPLNASGEETIKKTATPPTPKRSKAEPLTNRRILVAEDGKDNQRLIMFFLKQTGCVVDIVENGQWAVDQAIAATAKQAPYDAILMDMQMPVLDGYQATEQLRKAGYTGPIIAITAHALSDDRQRCIDAGCTDYITKPIDWDKLIQTLQEHIAQQIQSP